MYKSLALFLIYISSFQIYAQIVPPSNFYLDVEGNAIIKDTLTADYVIIKKEGLQISDYITTDDNFTDQSDALERAINDLFFSGDKYNALDLEGRMIIVNKPINFQVNTSTIFSKIIMNGKIVIPFTNNNFNTNTDYVFDFSAMGKLVDIQFNSIEFELRKQANGVLLDGNYVGFEFNNCIFTKPTKYGIKDTGGAIGNGGHELIVNDCSFRELDSGMIMPSNRDAIAISCASPDAKIINSIFAYFKHAMVLKSGGYQISGSHIYQGMGNNTALSDFTAGIELTSGSGQAVINGNYIDHTFIKLSDSTSLAADIENVNITNNFFLTNSSDTNFCFISFAPAFSNSKVKNVIIKDNVTRNIAAAINVQFIAVDTANGNIDKKNVESLYCKENTFENVVKVENPALVKVESTLPRVQHHAIFTNKFPLNAEPKFALSATPYALSAYTNWHVAYVNRGTHAVRIDTEIAVSGEWYVVASCNIDDGF